MVPPQMIRKINFISSTIQRLKNENAASPATENVKIEENISSYADKYKIS
jgi:hypothetical protein